jgi:hypothetical protein
MGPEGGAWTRGRALLILLPALAATVFHLGLMARYVGRSRGDVSVLVGVGKERAGQGLYAAVRTPLGRDGYDGQFYYALAQAPWRRHAEEIDAPAVRQLRILYPAVCWLLSGGDSELLLWVMPAVNLAAIGALAGLGAWLALRHGLSGWWGFLLPLALKPGLPALRNLTDPLATLALVGLLGGWLVRAPAGAVGLCAVAAVLGREQNAAIVALLLAAGVWARRGRDVAALGAALLVWAGWVLTLRCAYGVWPFLPGQGNFAGPLEGYLARWAHLGHPVWSRKDTAMHLAAMVGLTLQSLLALYLLLRAPAGERLMPLVALAGVALVGAAGWAIYEDAWSYMRVLVWLPAGLWLTGLRARQGWVLLLLAVDIYPTLHMAHIL